MKKPIIYLAVTLILFNGCGNKPNLTLYLPENLDSIPYASEEVTNEVIGSGASTITEYTSPDGRVLSFGQWAKSCAGGIISLKACSKGSSFIPIIGSLVGGACRDKVIESNKCLNDVPSAWLSQI